MSAQVATASTDVVTPTGVNTTAFPVAYQARFPFPARTLIWSPGLVLDGNTEIGGQVGVRFYLATVGQEGWIPKAQYFRPNTAPFWITRFPVPWQMPVNWHETANIVVEFYAASNLPASGSVFIDFHLETR